MRTRGEFVLDGSVTMAWFFVDETNDYANAVLAEALLAAGRVLDDSRALADGLVMLRWLLNVETAGDYISVTPVGGWVTG